MMMVTNRNFRRSGYLLLVLATGALGSSAILAAEPGTEAQVTIRAERPTKQVVGRTSTGVPIEQYELSYRVSYSDLDLATSAGADALKARVSKAADMACKDLDKLYPLMEPDRSCARKAEEGAMSQVNSAIKMAQAQGETKAR
ncbi:MAG TPA: UrcA family protein [Steroidobacteraceae bacterium]|jgi:UrcA family protein|nr:UrcA family protein [Steroidobacteraceae bacterium]